MSFRVKIQFGDFYEYFEPEDMIYFQANNKRVHAFSVDGVGTINKSLNAIEEAFPDLFIRIHRRTLVRTSCLVTLNKSQRYHHVGLTGLSETLRVGPGYKKSVREFFTHTSFPAHICAYVRRNMQLIPVEDIYYFQADEKYVTVKHTKGEVIISNTLTSLEMALGDRFIRIHRNALVAKNRINGLGRSNIGRVQVKIDQLDEVLDVSRSNVSKIRCFVRAK